MTQDGVHARTRRSLAAVGALVALLAGCGHPTGSPASARDGSGTGARGGIHVGANGVDLRITRPVAHLDASGSGMLSMTVANSGSVAEHLDMVGTPGGGRGTLVGGGGRASGAMTGGGVQILPGGSTGFGADHGPRIRVAHVHGVTAGRTLPVVLEFGVVGLVHMQAQVSRG
ncbi:hypothetical protein GCM10018793_23710 [Streptomyces sulfonofaciens]|uniref:Uncharacterized protein n=1 Tax=Streptomyces sulfonofaciens TaxID=68272 RepID=A0A919G498_9ACTN|nr:hypothetical protein [Streptomyces sulfonofaciens]GHH76890.1 hypothetical protein GCM10018793_23710 [Streptomyces sulfonofaciens]